MGTLNETFKTSLFATAASAVLLFAAGVRAEEVKSAETGEETDKNVWRSPVFSPMVSNFYLLGGAAFYDLDAMNSSLGDNGYTELKDPSLSLGIGWDMSIGRLILGVEGQWLKNVATEAEQDDLRADIDSKYWLARIGFDVAHWRGLRIYPLLGIGSGITKINISSESGASFDDVLADPGREVRMEQRGLLLDASLGIDYRFKVRETAYKSSFFTVGVRGGYLFAPYAGSWKTNAAEISGGPDPLMSGPTVQLMLGFSGERKRHCARNCRTHKK